MMDFSTLQGLTIPEGNVTQITDAAGQVLWELSKKVKITLNTTSSQNMGSMTHSELGSLNRWSNVTYEVSPGSTLTFLFKNESDEGNSITEKVIVNGSQVYSGSFRDYGATLRYTYTITKDATITVNCPKYSNGTVTIVES